MKKMAFVFLITCLAGAVLTAQEEEGMGLAAGTELIIADLENAESAMIIRPFIEFENSFDSFNIYAGLGIPIAILKIPELDYSNLSNPASNEKSETLIGLDFNLEGKYALSFNEKTSLAFSLGTWVYLPFDNKKGMATDYMYFGTGIGAEGVEAGWQKFSMYLNFGIQLMLTFGFGDLYFGFDLPFNMIGPTYENIIFDSSLDPYFQTVDVSADPFDIAEIQFTAGMNLKAGFGFGCTLYYWIGNREEIDTFMANTDIFLQYETKNLFLGVTFGIPLYENGVKEEGYTITPEFMYSFDFGLSLFASLPVSGLGSEEVETYGGTNIGLTVGVKFSF